MMLINFLQVTLNQPTQVEDSLNAFDLAVKGGWVMIPLTLLLVIAVYIFFERFMVLRNASRIDTNFMNRIKDYIHDGKIEAASTLCQSTDNPIARMIEKGISRLGRPLNDINTAVENIGNLEIAKLEKGLPMLATIAGGAPMLGFFGTVIGMVEAFYNMSKAGNNIDITLLSNGIYVAMVTTVGGLIVGILAYFAYNFLIARVSRIVYRLEASTLEFMDLLNEPVN
ncbi:MAG TPA: biopolymer transporter ExbB [Marinilabiliales bacterium]|jgi:biopolymer transport protein ExbB|nr:MotA/TolQ/ExbB proton channel family protein [Salinivirgaceae bacterium]HAM97410.1 biopolymer transporter ExbB [Marinilabiliales bacterium]HAZ00821.1 biopolymer transporter ExbB [Marinilabiliales bacterium]HBO76240.1 biopolymer transporter ExbB [Marinilabiliales bacterium]HBX85288.1 biopolymer transporter ExbB [Marinilabiliales bacterium]